MPTVEDVCRHVRSKNAGPFWITIDLFFPDRRSFDTYVESAALQPAAVAALFGVADARWIKRISVPQLLVLKISYPRHSPQGGPIERDMHGGQQFVRLLKVAL